MYEYHGWAMIRDTVGEESEGEQLDQIYQLLEERVKSYNWVLGLMDLRWVNLYPHLSVAGLNNHYTNYADEVFEIFNYIAEIAPGSYGILYTIDSDYENKFRVYVLSRGKLKEHDDPFLSPFVPVVEDPPGGL